jgi:hypothetical protein
MNDKDLDSLAAEAWIFGYPLVLMDVSRQVMTTQGAPPNSFDHMRAFPDHTFTDVVTPNADTLYSSAWLDLRDEPIVLSLPEMTGRYHMMPMLSGWTDVFAAPGSRTTGEDGGEFAICPPGWEGDLPAGVTRIDAPTSMVRVIGRTSASGTKDYLAVHALQNNYLLTPLSEFTEHAAPPRPVTPLSTTTDASAPVDQVARMDGPTFFSRLASLLADNPPTPPDQTFVDSLAALGIRPGLPLDLSDPAAAIAVAAAPSAGQAALRRIGAEMSEDTSNGWSIPRGLGSYGTDYGRRAYVAFLGLGANLDADAIYPYVMVDGEDRALNGGHQYVLHFEAGELPPVKGFWSLTMYDDKQFFVDNPIDRYAIGDRDNLTYGQDGSLDIWIQHEDPGAEFLSNWLPAPTGSFNLIFRAYWPQQAALDGTWAPPPITRLV